jgi:hypothetical protein
MATSVHPRAKTHAPRARTSVRFRRAFPTTASAAEHAMAQLPKSENVMAHVRRIPSRSDGAAGTIAATKRTSTVASAKAARTAAPIRSSHRRANRRLGAA